MRASSTGFEAFLTTSGDSAGFADLYNDTKSHRFVLDGRFIRPTSAEFVCSIQGLLALNSAGRPNGAANKHTSSKIDPKNCPFISVLTYQAEKIKFLPTALNLRSFRGRNNFCALNPIFPTDLDSYFSWPFETLNYTVERAEIDFGLLYLATSGNARKSTGQLIV